MSSKQPSKPKTQQTAKIEEKENSKETTGPIKVLCGQTDIEDVKLVSYTRHSQKGNHGSMGDDDHAGGDPCRPQRPTRSSKAERVLGLTAKDIDVAAQVRQNRTNRTHTSSGDSSSSNRKQPTDALLAPGASNSRANCQKSGWKTSSGEKKGFAQVASSSDLKRIDNGSTELEWESEASSQGGRTGDGESLVTGSASTSSYIAKKSTENRGRDRFKKILRPLTRSRSAGAGDRVPAYALFLKQQPPREPRTVNRSTDDVMTNSAAEDKESDDESTDGTSGSKVRRRSKDKKDRFAFFRRSTEGHSGQGPASPASNALLPSTETLRGWTNSIHKLLSDKYGLKLFREFLRREFSDENIDFWIECERYRQLTSDKERSAESKRIFREYVAVQAPNEINLDSKTRELTESNLSHPDSRVFEAAQKRIEALMEKDSFPRFLQSDLFLHLMQQRQAADSSLKIT